MEKYIPLSLKCPLCGKSLMDSYRLIHNRPTVKLEVAFGGNRGLINVCSFYGCSDHVSTIPVAEGDVVQLFCPHCRQELISHLACRECGHHMIPFSLEQGGRMYLCSRWGCNQHYLNFSNVSDALRRLYNEFGYF